MIEEFECPECANDNTIKGKITKEINYIMEHLDKKESIDREIITAIFLNGYYFALELVKNMQKVPNNE